MTRPRFCLERRCQDLCLSPYRSNLIFRHSAARSSVPGEDLRPLPGSLRGSVGVASAGLDKEGTACLERVFASSNEFHSCGRFPGAAAIRLALPRCDARLALVELGLPDGCGIWCARELLSGRPGMSVILVTAIKDALLLERAAAVGIADLLVKPLTVGGCLAALRFVLCRSCCGSWPKPVGAEGGLSSLEALPTTLPAHTWRDVERVVLELLAEGLMYKEIAGRIGRSQAATRKLIHGVYQKLGVGDRHHAVLRWRSISQRLTAR